jgi:hypothetical protein
VEQRCAKHIACFIDAALLLWRAAQLLLLLLLLLSCSLQNFPDAINQPTFPSVVLQPGETYKHQIVYRLSVPPS